MALAAHDVAAVRAAESLVLARVPEGSLMRRAAAALATVCLRELRARRSRVPGARVVLLVGAGDNGGDALWAGARLAERGARVDALLLSTSVHAAGLAALRAVWRAHAVGGCRRSGLRPESAGPSGSRHRRDRRVGRLTGAARTCHLIGGLSRRDPLTAPCCRCRPAQRG